MRQELINSIAFLFLYAFIGNVPELLSTLEFGGINTVIADGVRFGAGYRYFDGVSVISEYAVMEDSGQVHPIKELFDDRTGFTLAFKHNGNIYAQCGGGIVDILN